jgi:hypothetical protein
VYQERHNKSQSTQLTSAQLKEMIKDQENTGKGATEVKEEGEHGEAVLDPAHTS